MKTTVAHSEDFLRWQKQHRAFGIGMAIFTVLASIAVVALHLI